MFGFQASPVFPREATGGVATICEAHLVDSLVGLVQVFEREGQLVFPWLQVKGNLTGPGGSPKVLCFCKEGVGVLFGPSAPNRSGARTQAPKASLQSWLNCLSGGNQLGGHRGQSEEGGGASASQPWKSLPKLGS